MKDQFWRLSFLIAFALSIGSGVSASAISKGETECQNWANAQALSRTQRDQTYIRAETLMCLGEYAGAAKEFEVLVARYPRDRFNRERLAMSYWLSGELRGASRQYGALFEQENDASRRIKLSQLREQLNETQPFGVNWRLQYESSDNINNAPTKSELSFADLPKELGPQKGSKVNIGAVGYYRHNLSERTNLEFRLGAGVERYSVPTFDQSYVDASAAISHKSGNRSYGVQVYRGRNWGDNKIYGTQLEFIDGALQSRAIVIDREETLDYRGVHLSFYEQFRPKFGYGFQANWTKSQNVNREDYAFADNTRNFAQVYVKRQFFENTDVNIWYRRSQFQEVGANGDYQSQNNYLGDEAGLDLTFTLNSGYILGLTAQYGR